MTVNQLFRSAVYYSLLFLSLIFKYYYYYYYYGVKERL